MYAFLTSNFILYLLNLLFFFLRVLWPLFEIFKNASSLFGVSIERSLANLSWFFVEIRHIVDEWICFLLLLDLNSGRRARFVSKGIGSRVMRSFEFRFLFKHLWVKVELELPYSFCFRFLWVSGRKFWLQLLFLIGSYLFISWFFSRTWQRSNSFLSVLDRSALFVRIGVLFWN